MTQAGTASFSIIYEAARRRWPRVDWPRRAFEALCQREPPRYPDDLYLAGAAGHRIDAAWGAIEDEVSPQVCRILHRQPRADYTTEDLWGEIRTRLMEEDEQAPPLPSGVHPARILRYRAKVRLVAYLVVVAKRLAISRARRRQPLSLTAANDETPDHEPADPRAGAPPQVTSQAELIARLEQAVASAYATLDPEQRFLVAMVFGQGVRQKRAGAMLGWSESKTSRALSAVAQRLGEALEDLGEAEWDGAMRDRWIEAWRTCWAKADAPAAEPDAVGGEVHGA